ncbi:MAG: hypothetical protein DRI57_08235 [Deltaproteobacteria bacterium]|nr:MAG: hypothetical protein DRI57_08235 [Deltaproteobacteria bacterium]
MPTIFDNIENFLKTGPERLIANMGGYIQFRANFNDISENSLEAFEISDFSDDWNELMRLFLVRRTRSFIKNSYTDTDRENGREYLLFPDGSKSY